MISPTLLNVYRDGTTLHLRVDNLILEQETLINDTVTVWTLYECDATERIFAFFSDALGQPVYIDTYPEETATTVTVWVNYVTDEETFTCASAQQTSAAVSFADLQQRVMRIARLYHAAAQQHETLRRRTTQLTRRFQKEIENASDRSERKASFFQNTRPDKAVVYTTQHDVYASVLQRFHAIVNDVYSDNSKNSNQSGTT